MAETQKSKRRGMTQDDIIKNPLDYDLSIETVGKGTLKSPMNGVPFVSETMDRLCPEKAFIRLDFPAFLQPKNAICTRSPKGISLSPIL